MFTTHWDGNLNRLPDFIIPGAAKSGTTTLYQQLSAHPKIFFPKDYKEQFYFSFGGTKPNYTDERFNQLPVWKTNDYLNLYSTADKDQLCGDASTSYLYTYDEALNNMRKLYADDLKKVKVIILLRDPVNRAYSHYTYLIRNGFENRSFSEAISDEGIIEWRKKRWGFDYLKYGEYYNSVKAFIQSFDNVKILLTEDLKEPQKTLDEVCDFLEIERLTDSKEIQANPSGMPKNKLLVNSLRKNKFLKTAARILPERTKFKAKAIRDKMMSKLLTKVPLPPADKQKLLIYYQNEIEQLETLIDRDLSHWKGN